MAERNHQLTADIEDHVAVDSDVSLLHRVTNNLLENELVPSTDWMPDNDPTAFPRRAGRVDDRRQWSGIPTGRSQPGL